MEPFVWDAYFTTGIARVDEQHRELVNLINALGTSLGEPASEHAEHLQTVFDHLAAYARHHFSDEEQIMEAAGLDPEGREHHRRMHADFLEQVTWMWSQRTTMAHPREILHGYLSAWLGFHILGDDQVQARQFRDIATGIPADEALRRASVAPDGPMGSIVRALRTLSQVLSEQNRDLAEVNAQLEERVNARTRDLALANEQLLLVSRTDGLLGIANRGAFDRQMEQEWGRARRAGVPIGLIMLDVDHFKRFNDTYGHQAGDRALQAVADAAGCAIRRPGDFLARYGGEELAVILPATAVDGIRRVAENIVSAVRGLLIPHETSSVGPWLTLSAGAATLVPDRHAEASLATAALIAAADAALYAAKKAGRGRVCVAPEAATAT